jgi:hypothetical protein
VSIQKMGHGLVNVKLIVLVIVCTMYCTVMQQSCVKFGLYNTFLTRAQKNYGEGSYYCRSTLAV